MYLNRASSHFSFSSSPHQKPMTNITLHIFFFSLFLFYTPICVRGVSSSLGGQRSLKVSYDEFLSSLKLVDSQLQDVSSNLLQLQTNIVQYSDYPRLPSAVSTCLQLMKLSTEELSWCVSGLKSPEGKYDGTGNLGADLSTWLGAILANVDTCIDGFEDTSESIKSQIFIGLEKVNSLISDLLNQVETVDVDHFTTHGQLPSWVKPSDEELLLTKDVRFDVMVAADGTGNYTKVMDAVNSAPESSIKRYVIYIKKGVYNETIVIDKNKKNLMMFGDGREATIISGDMRYQGSNFTTYKTATFCVQGRGFIAKYMSFRNTAGPLGYQAVALVSDSEFSVFYRCGFDGYQDTLYVHAGRQFYKECTISGTVDFIFGYGAAVFQDCLVLVKKGLEKQTNTITAQGRKRSVIPYGFSFQFCNVSAHSSLLPFLNSTQTFLGRPWKEYSTVVFMESYLSDVVSPLGWSEWNGTTVYLDTLYYGEYHNYGLGSGVQKRVNWTNYHVLNDPSQVSNFTVAQLLSGNQWLPLTGVPYTPGLGHQNITGRK